MADIGYLMNNWAEPGGGRRQRRGRGVAVGGGRLPDARARSSTYSRKTGRDVSNVDYYRAFQYWRLAAIVEGVMARYLKGVMGGKKPTPAVPRQIDGLAASALTARARAAHPLEEVRRTCPKSEPAGRDGIFLAVGYRERRKLNRSAS
jgi:hypothetical protein